MGFKLVRVDAAEPCKIPLPIGEHIIGRGKFLYCDDRRVSRNHAQLVVDGDSISLKSLHQNPCYYKTKTCTDTLALFGPEASVKLTSGDQIGLIHDSYWYEIIHCDHDTPSEAPDSKEKSPLGHTMLDTEMDTQSINGTDDKSDSNRGCDTDCEDQLLASENDEIKGEATSKTPQHQDEEQKETVQDDQNKTVKIEKGPQDQPSTSNAEPTTPSKRSHTDDSPCDQKKVKLEPGSPTVEQKLAVSNDKPVASNDQGCSSDDINGAAAPAPQPAKPQRERCIYGAGCYRKNPHHKAQFSHPADPDWGGGERGECPWGAQCRKADPRHWAAHAHPAGARPPRARQDAGKRHRRRQRSQTPESGDGSDSDSPSGLMVTGKRARKTVVREKWSDSEGDEDPFKTDEEDEWVPGDSTSQSQSQDW